ncbi:MAG: hypothetical protein ABSG04_05785 [Verrucomicrobiota bacterium]|jgi:hypothetical protein
MKKLNPFLVGGGVVLTLALSGVIVLAQVGGPAGGGNGGANGVTVNRGGGANFAGGGPGGGRGAFDFSQIVPMMVQGMRQQLGVNNDDEWNAIEPRLEKVVKLKMEERTAGISGMMGGMMGGRGMGGGAMPGLNALTGDPDPAVDALQKAVDNNAPAAEVKAAMAKVRDARQQKRQALLKAQQDLKEILSIRQEATLLLMGQLD